LLALNTVQNHTGIAIVEDGACSALFEEEQVGRRSTYLLAVLHDLLDKKGVTLQSLDGIAVCTGPGTFTGIRVGMAVARGLAYAASLPLVGVTAFDAYAHQWSPPGTLVLALDARRGEIYTQVRRKPGDAPEPRTQTPEELAEIIRGDQSLAPVQVNGDALNLYGDRWVNLPEVRLAPHEQRLLSVKSVAEVGAAALVNKKKGLDPFEIQPSYIRRSDRDLQLK
jgi:tRNA threonylcarbamoyladenosine biosynthesis protein TsaB